jgi:hypothetical protein
MGRWAEVYFTAAPERREEAVYELLRELEAENPAQYGSAESNAVMGSHLSASEVATTRCRTCGRENPATHTFCGMCGARLEHASANDPAPEHHALLDALRASSSGESTASRDSSDSWLRSEDDVREEPSPTFGAGEFSLFQTGRISRPDDEFIDPPSHPYRFYIGAVVLLAIAALGYFAWRNSRANSQSGYIEPQAPPAETAQPAAQAAAPAPLTQPSGSAAKDASTANPAAPEPVTKPERAEQATTKQDAEKPVRTPASLRENAAKTPARSGAGNGAEELAVAQGFLNGANGHGRDSTEAAKWLWKAMGDKNTEAALLLSDLYLRGDGVPKSCDQGRILLDAAAKNGLAQAGDRLRHLDAFGCR